MFTSINDICHLARQRRAYQIVCVQKGMARGPVCLYIFSFFFFSLSPPLFLLSRDALSYLWNDAGVRHLAPMLVCCYCLYVRGRWLNAQCATLYALKITTIVPVLGAHEFYSSVGCATTKCKAALKIGFRYAARTQHSSKTPNVDAGCKQVACTNKNSRQVYIVGTTKLGGDKCKTKLIYNEGR